MTSTESGELLELAEASGLVHCTNFNIRFYPMVQEARARVRDGGLGEVWNAHGGYLQDWLQQPTDWNWRLEPERGGELRAVGDIGSHWLDLVQFVTGMRVESLLADLATAIPVRRRPVGEVETYAAAGDIERREAPDDDARTSRTSCCASRAGRAGRSSSRRSAPAARTRCASSSTARAARSRGTPSARRSCGSATATSRTRRSCATRGC